MIPIERRAVRAILITPDLELLLMRIQNPGNDETFWICPGGGLEKGEDLASGLRRELREELGLASFEAHHELHHRHHIFNWRDKRISQHEVFFAVRVDKFEPTITDPVEAEVVQEFRWWPLGELDSTTAPVSPRGLKQIIERYLSDGPPRGPLALDIQVD